MIHVVSPHHKADHADRRPSRRPCPGSRRSACLTEGRDDVADDPEARQDHDIDLGVAEEPEQVLEQHRIATRRSGSKNAVPKFRSQISMVMAPASTGTARTSRNAVTSIGPDEERHAVQRHARRAHVEDRGDEVDCAQQGADAPARCSANSVQSMPMPGSKVELDSGGYSVQPVPDSPRYRPVRISSEGRRQQPEADVVQAREGHVRRADHQRDEPVAEAADQRRHDREEDHDQAVRRDDGVPLLGPTLRCVLPGMLQLRAHDDRQQQADRGRRITAKIR